MEIKVLEGLGLTNSESKVYLALLKIGSSKTGDILKKSGLNSGKIYEILESLKEKGLVSESIVNNVRNFSAAPPSQLLDYLERKKEEIVREESELKKNLPSLEKIRNEGIKETKAVTYLGFKGIKTAADEALDSMKKGEEIFGMGVTERKDRKYNDFWLGWTERRIKKGIIARHIFSERGDYYNLFKKLKLTESKVLTGLTPVTIDIFGEDKVLILNYNEPASCTMIYDKNTAISFKNFFNQLWGIAKK